jgi:hypothetical protein
MRIRGDVRMRTTLVILAALLLTGCVLDSTTTAARDRAGSGGPTDLSSARAAWEAAGIDSYQLVVTVTGCMACAGPEPWRTSTTVTDGHITDRTVPARTAAAGGSRRRGPVQVDRVR